MNRRFAGREFLAGTYSIAGMACIGWASWWKRQGQDIDEFPCLKLWLGRMLARPAVARGLRIRIEEASQVNMQDPSGADLTFATHPAAGS